MIIVNSDQSISVRMSTAAAPALTWAAAYDNIQNTFSSSPQKRTVPSAAVGTTNGITAVDIVPSPPDGFNELTYFYLANTDAVNRTAIVQADQGGIIVQIYSVDLDPGSRVIYTKDSGWSTFTSTGIPPSPGTGLYLEIANNLSDVSNALTAFNNIKQSATETYEGVAEIATQAETNTGTDDTRFVTPLKFQTRLAAYAQPLDSDLTTIAGLTPANDDVLQYKSGAWANRTTAQYYADLQASVKDDVYFTIPLIAGALSPADSTTYYIGFGGLTPTTTDTSNDMSLGYDFTVIGAVITVGNNSTSGSSTNCTAYLRNVTDATSTLIGNFATNGSTTNVISTTITGLSINVDAADDFIFQFDTPAYAVNPIGMTTRVLLICKRR